MTKRDFEIIASVLADAESFIIAAESHTSRSRESILGMKQMHENIRKNFLRTLKRDHPRFNEGTFDVAARPVHHYRLKNEILKSLGMDES
jgi:hypothetical protein